MQRRYIPFTDLKKRHALIVDSLHPYGTPLAHWRGARTPPQLRDDTSAGSVLTALRLNHPALDAELVTANHFDIDGFVGVWSLLYPAQALQHETVLREMALIGDFRELDLQRPGADQALQLVCWINALEKSHFYPPFGADELEDSEVFLSPPKFEFFLARFGEILKQPETGREYWQAEYERVLADYATVHNPDVTRVTPLPALGLIILETKAPLHYYALFGMTSGYDIVLSQYAANRYELEYKYTTWVDLASRPGLPRVSLHPLAQQLNALEKAAGRWHVDPVTDTGPILRLDEQPLNKQVRYANPYERPILSSSITPETFRRTTVQFFEEQYRGIQPKKYWTWEEIKALGR